MSAGPNQAPPSVQRFLLEIVDSFEKLEVVLRLANAPAGARVADRELGDPLGIRADLAAEALIDLVADGVVSGTAARGWRLDASSPWATAGRALATMNGQDRAAVVNLMMSTSMERLRGKTARAFADAFRLWHRKEEGSDG